MNEQIGAMGFRKRRLIKYYSEAFLLLFLTLEMLLVLFFCVLIALVKVNRLRSKAYIIFSFVK